MIRWLLTAITTVSVCVLVVAQTGGAASAHRANPLGVHFNHTSEDPAALTSCDLLAKSAALAAKGPLWNWHTTGPNGGIVFSIASDPSTPGTLYAATLERGVYKTVDGGGHWIHVGPDHTDVYCVAVDPHRPNVVYAGAYNHGVLKSVDRGASWTVSSLGIGTPIIYSLAVDPTDSNIVYAGGSFALYRSTDAGAAWREVALPVVVATCSAITIDPTDARTIYVGGTASAILKTTDGGATWQLFGDGAGLHEAILNGIAIDVADHNLVYAATVDGIYRSVNGGATWELRGDTIVFRAIVADRVRPGVAYAAAESGGVLVTTNRGDTWEPLDAGLTTPVTLALAVDASTPGNLFVGTGGRCVFRRASAGGPWELTDEGFDALSVYAVVVDPSAPGVAYAASFGGVFKSTDAGETWRYVGLDYVRSIAIDPSDPSVLYAASLFSGLYKSTDGGETWAGANEGITDPIVEAVAVNPSRPNTVYCSTNGYASEDHDTFFRSDDGGAHWVRMTPVTFDPITGILVAPGAPPTIFVKDVTGAIATSVDEGQTWRYPSSMEFHIEALGIAIDPQRPSAFYAAGFRGVFRSADSGLTWKQVGYPNFAYGLEYITVDPRRSDHLIGGTPGLTPGMFESFDGGDTWTRVGSNAPNAYVNSLALDPSGSVAYAGTQRGVAVLRVGTAVPGYTAGGRIKGPGHASGWADVVLSFEALDGSVAPEEVTPDAHGVWRQGGFRAGVTYRVTARRVDLQFKRPSSTFDGPSDSINFKVVSPRKT